MNVFYCTKDKGGKLHRVKHKTCRVNFCRRGQAVESLMIHRVLWSVPAAVARAFLILMPFLI